MSANESTVMSVRSFIPYCLRKVDSFFPCEFCKVPSSAPFFNFQRPLVPLSPSSSRLRLLPHLPVPYSFSVSFNNLFQKAVATQDVTNPVTLHSS